MAQSGPTYPGPDRHPVRLQGHGWPWACDGRLGHAMTGLGHVASSWPCRGRGRPRWSAMRRRQSRGSQSPVARTALDAASIAVRVGGPVAEALVAGPGPVEDPVIELTDPPDDTGDLCLGCPDPGNCSSCIVTPVGYDDMLGKSRAPRRSCRGQASRHRGGQQGCHGRRRRCRERSSRTAWQRPGRRHRCCSPVEHASSSTRPARTVSSARGCPTAPASPTAAARA